MLDIDFGTYPYVTSSNCTAGAVCTGLGIGPKAIREVLGVSKAYVTRVGGGPFPTEMPPDLDEKIREIGKEYGATTQRPRRCGWLDLVALRYAAQINGLTAIAMTKLDVFDTLADLQVCVAYRYKGGTDNDFPQQSKRLRRMRTDLRDTSGMATTPHRSAHSGGYPATDESLCRVCL